LALFLFLTFNFGLSTPLRAQGGFTTVTGTIKDPGGITYACGTISAQLITAGGPGATLNGGGFTTQTSPVALGCPTSPGTGAPGSFAMRLADSGVIVPSNTSWKFTVNLAPGVVPPLGVGPQSFTVTTAINCSTNTPAPCSSNTIDISTVLSASAPALATPSVESGGGGGPTYILASSFGVTGTAQYLCDATFTNTSAVVTTPTTDVPFKAADVGSIDWGSAVSCGGNSNGIPTTLIAQGTILSFTSAHSITVSATASGGCIPTLADNCPFVWGPDNTSQLQAAWTSLAAAGCPGVLVLPAGGILIQSPPVATSNCVAPGSGSPVAGFTVQGQGQYSTTILTSPNMTWGNPMFQMTATNGVGVFGQRMTNFGVASFVKAAAAENRKSGFFLSTIYSEYDHLSVQQWYPSDGTFTFAAFTLQACGGCQQNMHDFVFVGAGTTSININTSDGIYVTNGVIQSASCTAIGAVPQGPHGTIVLTNIHAVHNGNGCGNNGGGLWVNTGTGTVVATNSLFDAGAFPTNAGDGCTVSSGTLVLINSVCNTTSTAANIVGLRVSPGAFAFTDGTSNIMSSAANGQFGINNGGTLTLRGTLATNGGTSVSMTNSGTVIFKEGNSFPQGITNTGIFQTISGTGGYSGACTGVVTSATTVGLYTLGQFTTTTCATAVTGLGQVASKAGTVYALYCTATAGNQATSACTLVKNGAAQTMTCSLNGAASCTDGTVAHQVAYVAGDILSVSATAGAADTLANVKGTIVAQ